MSKEGVFLVDDYFVVGCDDLEIEIPKNIHSTDELMKAYYRLLSLPGYFGFNWNALYDCLRDLSWIKTKRVVLIHRDIPIIESEDWIQYVEVLYDSVRDWKLGEDHELIVCFPEKHKQEVLNLIQ